MTDKPVKEGGVWGIIVIFSAFCIQVVTFGSSQSIGVYNIEFLRTFDVGAAAVSLVGAINLGLLVGGGLVCSFLLAKWSHRQVALLGATLSNIGLICMPFAPNLPYMYAFYGVLGGLGYSLTFVPALILSGLYYSRYRSLSTGTVTAGAGLGSILFPMIIYNCIQYYGWRGSLLILAGLNLHLFIFAALLRPVPKALLKAYELQERIAKAGRHADENHDISNDSSDEDLEKRCQVSVIAANKETLNSLQNIEGEETKQCVDRSKATNNDGLDKTVGKYVTVIDVNYNRLNSIQPKETPHNGERLNGIHGVEIGCLDENEVEHVTDIDVKCNTLHSLHQLQTGDKAGTELKGVDDDSTDTRVHVQHLDAIDKEVKHIDATSSTLVVSPIVASEVQTESIQSGIQKLRSHLKTVFIFDFIIFCLNNICWNIGEGIIVVFLPKYVSSVGITEENASNALSAFGAGTGLGAISGGLMGNLKCCDRISLYISGNIGTGVFTMLVSMPYFHTFAGFMFLSAMIGYMYGIGIGLLVVVTSDLLGTAVLGYGVGYLLLSNGIGLLSGPPFAGALIDHFGSLEPALYLSACFALCGGVVMTVVPLRRVCRRYCTKIRHRP